MEDNILTKMYSLISGLIHPHELKPGTTIEGESALRKVCTITGLNISMQTPHSKFLSAKGIDWYYTNEPENYTRVLLPYLSENWKTRDLKDQFIDIAHNIRNKDSNPRNSIKRKISRLLEDENSLFDPLTLIDKSKLKEAGYSKSL